MKTAPYLKLLKQKKTKASFLVALLPSAVSLTRGIGFYALPGFFVSFFLLVVLGLTDQQLTDRGKWLARHRKFCERQGNVDVLMIGDSLTAGWPTDVLQEHFGAISIANFGINGDFTHDILWRIQNGTLDKLQPKLVLLLAGANNIGTNETADEIAASISRIVTAISEKRPDTAILLLGIFPIEQLATSWKRTKIQQVNHRISQLHKDKRIVCRNIGRHLTDENGTLHKKVTPDYRHLSKDGYRIVAGAISNDVWQLIGGTKELQ